VSRLNNSWQPNAMLLAVVMHEGGACLENGRRWEQADIEVGATLDSELRVVGVSAERATKKCHMTAFTQTNLILQSFGNFFRFKTLATYCIPYPLGIQFVNSAERPLRLVYFSFGILTSH
jgi:hypothetical protein